MDTNQAIFKMRSIIGTGGIAGLDNIVAGSVENQKIVLEYANDHLKHTGLQIVQNQGQWEIRDIEEFNKAQLMGFEGVSRLEHITEFVTGNYAKFTLKHTGSGNRFLYHLKRPYTMEREWDKDERKYVRKKKFKDYIQVHIASHRGDKLYLWKIGRMYDTDKYTDTDLGLNFISYRCADRHKKAQEIFEALFRRISTQRDLPDTWEVWHMGHCAKCGKALSHPDSLQNGIGPDCIKKIKDERGVTIPQ